MQKERKHGEPGVERAGPLVVPCIYDAKCALRREKGPAAIKIILFCYKRENASTTTGETFPSQLRSPVPYFTEAWNVYINVQVFV